MAPPREAARDRARGSAGCAHAWLRSPPLPRDYIAIGVYSKCAGVLGIIAKGAIFVYNYFKVK